MTEPLKIGNFTYEKHDERDWVWKADLLKPFKKNGTLKAQYKDMPRFKVINEYEDKEVKDFEDSISQAVKDISVKLLSFTK